MRADRVVHVVHCHAEGEVGDVVVGGIAPPPGNTVWEQSRFIARDGTVREFLLNEPRGGVFRHVNLLVPATTPGAASGFIIMEPEDTPPMSGSNSMCVATVVVESGMVPMVEPITEVLLDAPAGPVQMKVHCSDSRVDAVTVRNVPSFVSQQQIPLEVPELGTLMVDTAFGGDSFVILPARALGFGLTPDEAHDIAEVGMRIVRAVNEQYGFTHPLLPEWDHVSFAFITGELEKTDEGLTSTNACVINPGKLDRSPTGTGCSAFMALLHAQGRMTAAETYVGKSIIGSRFVGTIADLTDVNGIPAIVPEITGRTWIYGTSQYYSDARDPWPTGYRLSDTWPMPR